VRNCLFLSHPFSRIKSFDQWAGDRDPVFTSTAAKIGKKAIPQATYTKKNYVVGVDPRASLWVWRALQPGALHWALQASPLVLGYLRGDGHARP